MRATVPSTRVSAAGKEDRASDRVLKVRLKPFLGAPLRLFVVQFAFVLIALDQTSELLPSHRGRRGTRETDEIPDGTGLRRVSGILLQQAAACRPVRIVRTGAHAGDRTVKPLQTIMSFHPMPPGMALLQQLEHFIGGQGAAEEIALHGIAALRSQKIELLLGFDAFGHDPEMQATGHGDDGGDDGRVVLVYRDISHESLVDLDDVDGQALEIAQRGITGAEIIDGNADSS